MWMRMVELGSARTGGRYTKEQAVEFLTSPGDPDAYPGAAEPAGGPAGDAADGGGGGGNGGAPAAAGVAAAFNEAREHQASDNQGEQQGGRVRSPEPEAEAEGEAAAGTSSWAAAAGTSTVGEQQAASGGWEDERPGAAPDEMAALLAKLAKLGLFELASSAFIAKLARGAVDVDELAAAFQQAETVAPTDANLDFGMLRTAGMRDIAVAALAAVNFRHVQVTGKPLRPAGKNTVWVRFPGSRPSAPGFATPYSAAHNSMPLYVLACQAVQYDSLGGAQLLKPALVECVQRFVCGEDEGKRCSFAAAHQAADAAAQAVAAAGIDSLTPAQKDAYKAALLADPVHKRLAQDMVDVWGEGQPLAVAYAELADHIPVLEKLLVGEASEVQPAAGTAAVQAALLALAPLGFEAALGVTPAIQELDWIEFSGDMLRGMAERLDADVAKEQASRHPIAGPGLKGRALAASMLRKRRAPERQQANRHLAGGAGMLP
ncbi:hypothetical protein COHA_007842 [Chlorella ohadii]|uniref:Uncharacterized protein n=1 Tax=Chlorella ohadii TaxID=2649997 RepID=A0AAD5H316_9CHLO|nr:hypothetical protein COHA_007842 [Chlorella ohadii]